MLNFKSFLSEAKKSLAHSSKVSNDDKGKLHELLLAKHLSHNNELPLHHRSESENKEHAGTPQQVHDRLKEKIGEHAYHEINSHAHQTAQKVKEHLKNTGHVSSTHPISDVHWTSNRDTEKKAGDHEKTTGTKDVNSNADVMLTTKHKKTGAKGYVGVSAKYGSESKPNLKNAGLNSLEKQAGHEAGTYTKIQKKHESHMESIGYKGTQGERHAQYKEDKAKLESEKAAHKETGSKKPFAPKSAVAKRAHAAEQSSLKARTEMAKLHAGGLSSKSDSELRQHVKDQASPPTTHHHIIAHSHVQSDGSVVSHVHDAHSMAEHHLSNYKNLHVRHSGISTDIMGTHKDTGKVRKIATQTFKASSGPHKGTAGAFKLA